MSLRVLVVGVELSAGLLLLAWGVASAVRPTLWRWRGARWWVNRTRARIPRVHGLGVGLIGAAIAVSAPAPLVISRATAGGVDAQSLEVIGLVVVVLGAALLAASYPTLREEPARHEHLAPEHSDPVDPGAAVHGPAPALVSPATAP